MEGVVYRSTTGSVTRPKTFEGGRTHRRYGLDDPSALVKYTLAIAISNSVAGDGVR